MESETEYGVYGQEALCQAPCHHEQGASDKKISAKHRATMSKARTDKKHSADHRANSGEAMKGIKRSAKDICQHKHG